MEKKRKKLPLWATILLAIDKNTKEVVGFSHY